MWLDCQTVAEFDWVSGRQMKTRRSHIFLTREIEKGTKYGQLTFMILIISKLFCWRRTKFQTHMCVYVEPNGSFNVVLCPDAFQNCQPIKNVFLGHCVLFFSPFFCVQWMCVCVCVLVLRSVDHSTQYQVLVCLWQLKLR